MTASVRRQGPGRPRSGNDARLYVRLSPADMDALRELADARGKSVADYVRRMIHRRVEKHATKT